MARLRLILSVILLVAVNSSDAAHLHKEKEYQQAWCRDETEVVLSDGSRADCITRDYAVEVDFGPKWPEAIGQALHYALLTGKLPGILLIIETPRDWSYFRRLQPVADAYQIRLWTITPKELPQWPSASAPPIPTAGL